MATSRSTDDRSESVSVLVVDEDPGDARDDAEALELVDSAVSTRAETDPDAARAHVAAGSVDCVVIDPGAGSGDDLDLLDRLARTDDAVRAIVLAAEDDPDIARAAWERGAAYAREDPDIDRYDVVARHLLGRTDPP